MAGTVLTLVLILALPLAVMFQEPSALQFEATPESLSVLAGAGLSLLFAYVPGFASWFQKLGDENPEDNGTKKRLVMLAILFMTVLIVIGFSCAGILGGVTCDKAGIIQVIWCFILAMIANQSTFLISPKTGLNS